MPCMTVEFDPAIGPIITIGIALPRSLPTTGRGGDGEPADVAIIHALVDTGASVTCISRGIAEEVDLPLIGKVAMSSASEVTPANVYLGDVALPFGEPGKSHWLAQEALQLAEFNADSPHYQALLGRDVLGLGLVTMTGYDRRPTICM